MNIEVQKNRWISKKKVEHILCLLYSEKPRLKLIPYLSIAIVSSPAIAKLNYHYRQKPSPTDVLSFLYPGAMGEIFLCVSYIRRQALLHNVPLKEEIHRMLIHGLLHLHGFEHERTKAEANRMFKIQESLLTSLGFTSREWSLWVASGPQPRLATKKKPPQAKDK